MLLTALVVLAINGQTNAQSAAVQAYSTTSPLQSGTIVQLDGHDSSSVEALTQSNVSDMFGVVVPANSSPITLSNPDATSTQAYVATSGSYNVLVSTQDGDIASGNYITISAIDGVGMKAGTTQPLVLGKALESFNGSNSLSTASLKAASGTSVNVDIGSIPVAISVAHNPLMLNTTTNLPAFLQKATQAVTTKPVSTSKVYLGLAIIVIATSLSGGLMYAGVKSSIVAIGRNPLSRKSVLRGLLQVTLIALTIFILGLFGVYLLLIL